MGGSGWGQKVYVEKVYVFLSLLGSIGDFVYPAGRPDYISSSEIGKHMRNHLRMRLFFLQLEASCLQWSFLTYS